MTTTKISPKKHAQEPFAAGSSAAQTTDKPTVKQSGPQKNSQTGKTATGKAKKTTPAKKRARTKKNKKTARKHSLWLRVLLGGLEVGSLISIGVYVLMILLGYGAEYLTGTSFFYNLLPFALAVLAVVLASALFLRGWWWLRTIFGRWHISLVPLLALTLAAGAGILLHMQIFTQPLAQFRLLVGGKAEIRILTLRHQVFAAYRRLDTNEMAKMLLRAQVYAADIEEAAQAFGLDPDLLNGLAAAESSFYPRMSADGGQGLFQITAIPNQAIQQALRHLQVKEPDMALHRHNTFAAAATLRYYLSQMNGNMVLGLLAYNIGPANGGLQFIMQQYSATDFITIQPYLQENPRNYPVRVLAYALAFRINRQEQRLLPYEEGLNAIRVQHIGIPGL